MKFSNLNLTYRRWTTYPAGLVDYRPGCRGLVNHSMAGIIMEQVKGFEVKDVNMLWAKDQSQWWNNPLDFRPSTVNNISLINFRSGVFDK